MPRKPLWISHRGYTKQAVENTRAAFQAAVDRGFSALETDLRLTRDGRLVLVHDPDLTALAGDRRRVQDMTAAELAGLTLRLPENTPFDDRAGAVAEADRKVMFFDDFAAEFAQCRWTLDIKPEAGEATLRALARWADAEAMTYKIIADAKMLTWHPDHEALARKLFPGLQLYARQPECWRAGLAALIGFPGCGGIEVGKTYALTPRVFGLSLFRPEIVRCFHQRGASVIAFLPPAGLVAQRAVAVGFDEILTNHEIETSGGPIR